MTIEQIKTICINRINACIENLEFMQEDEKQFDDNAKLGYMKNEFENKYKALFSKTEWKKILDTLSDGNIDDFVLYSEAIKKRLLVQIPMPYTTNPINNICSIFEFECLQEIYSKMVHVITCYNNNKFHCEEIKQRFIEYAKQRAKESLNTSYAWQWEHLYPTEEDENLFIQVIEDCKHLNWKDENDWERLLDWFEDLPIY